MHAFQQSINQGVRPKNLHKYANRMQMKKGQVRFTGLTS